MDSIGPHFQQPALAAQCRSVRAPRQHLIPRAGVDHAPGFDHDHGVEAREQAGAMHRRDDAGRRERGDDAVEHAAFGRRVERAGGFVEQQQRTALRRL